MSGAIISSCGLYRYFLWRDLAPLTQHKTCLFVMLNPSTADGVEDDPTIRRCKQFAADFQCDRLEVVNLFSYRATDPKYLIGRDYTRGPDHFNHVNLAIMEADLVVCGWGGKPIANKFGIAKEMTGFIRNLGKVPHYLKLTKSGAPWHPLYLSADMKPQIYEG